MDSKLFRLPTSPNFYSGIASADPFELREQQKRSQLPTSDTRFPGWAAPMSDGRLVTEYAAHCSQNIPSRQQFATKEWMTKNADQIIRVTRERLSQVTGSFYGLDKTVVPPPALIVKCATDDCTRTATYALGGIGVERADSAAPDLFGTWEYNQVASTAYKTPITTTYEGGRNTPRG